MTLRRRYARYTIPECGLAVIIVMAQHGYGDGVIITALPLPTNIGAGLSRRHAGSFSHATVKKGH